MPPSAATPTDYDYTIPMLIFMCLGLAAIVFCILLGREDRRHGYGIQNLPKKSE